MMDVAREIWHRDRGEGGNLRRGLAVFAPLVVLALLAWAPAVWAKPDWVHGGAGAATCSSAEQCHPSMGGRSDATCTSCHPEFVSPSGKWCWSCHRPGQDLSSQNWAAGACTQTCHMFTETDDDDCESCHGGYWGSFSHGSRPHGGADSAPCTSCHAVSKSIVNGSASPHHGGKVPDVGDCAACHNGQQGSAKVGHAGKPCATCHDGMDIPKTPILCNICHSPTTYGTEDCVKCHGSEQIHSEDPGSKQKTCTACHADKTSGHYPGLGTCTTCHQDAGSFHHLGATPTPVDQCATCHKDKQPHDGIKDCEFCHDGMDRPDQQKVCGQCHSFGDKVLPECTVCHSKAGMSKHDQVHSTTPGAGVTCVTCHKPHYVDLGACDTCHAQTPLMHHGAAKVQASAMTLTAKPISVKKRGKALLSGVLTSGGQPQATQSVTLQALPRGAKKYKTVTTLTTGADGGFSLTVKPVKTTVYRATWKSAGSTSTLVVSPAAAQATVRVK